MNFIIFALLSLLAALSPLALPARHTALKHILLRRPSSCMAPPPFMSSVFLICVFHVIFPFH